MILLIIDIIIIIIMETRVQRYKKHRLKIISEGSVTKDDVNKVNGKHFLNNASTLPLHDVFNTEKEDELISKKKSFIEKKKNQKIIASIVIVTVVILAIILIAIFVFRG